MRSFNKIVSASIIAALVLLLSHGMFVKNAYAADEYDLLRDKWREVLTGGMAYDPLDPDIANRISSITSTAQSNWDAMDKTSGRTYLWSDLSSPSTTSHMTASYNRLREMAVAYATKGSPLENNAALLSDIVSALDWMYANRYNESKTETFNWWDWEIGVPLALNDIVVILYNQLTSAQIVSYMNAVGHFQPAVLQTGANRVWECTINAVRGIIVKDSAKIAGARDGLSAVLAYITTGNGFYEDGSFIEHVKYSYNGGYGKALLSSISKVLYVLDGSAWTVTDPNKQNVFKWVYDSFEPLIYKGSMLDMTRGREISRADGENHAAGHDVIQSIIQIAQFAPEPDAAKFKSMVKYWIQADTSRNFFAYATLYTIVKGKAIVNDAAIVSRGELVKYKQYPAMDRAVQLRPGYGFGLSMSSSRIANYESINFENWKGWYTGDGMTYLYNNDLTGYSDGFWPTVNPYRPPGTTVDTQTRANGSGYGYLSSKNWAGGTSILDAFGVSGMELSASGSTLTAKKSWFMFDNEIVALGSGITSTDSRTIETIVDNRKINSTGDNALTVNGTVKPAGLGWSETMSSVSWIHLAGNAPGSDVGYYFPDAGTTVKGLREARTGSWNAINGNESTAPLTRNYLSLWFDHGINPTNGAYSYVILPNKTATEVSSYAANPDITIMENSANTQAVKENTLNITGVNFWNDIVKSAGGITSNKKASVMTHETANDIEVAISDPTWANNGTISIEINQSAYGILSADSRITVTQLSPTIKMTVNVNGARGGTFKAKFGFNSGTPVTPVSNLALNKTVTASSSFSNSNWNIVNSVDGERNSISGKYGWTSNNNLAVNHTERIQVDLGSATEIGRVDLYPRNDAGNVGYGFPVDFTIQLSADGTTWNTVVTRTGYPLPGNAVQSFGFPPTQARYIKVEGTNLRKNPSDNNLFRMQLAEIEVYQPAPAQSVQMESRGH
ncbi:discoidin domain-containing protein [Paenibacillus sp. P25]|nr:discoidin domain-containing protein [Paenibacillus sp. P25]